MTLATEAGHWYAPDGSPAYQVPSNDGFKNTTLREARVLGLYPSVTTIIRCAATPQLEKWKRDNPNWEQISGDARDLGSLIHGCIEQHLTGVVYDPTYRQHVEGAVAAIAKWCGLEGLRPEKSFAHPLGFGGKCDVHKPGFVADYKTKEFNEEKLPSTYENHAMQLAAYREGFNMPTARCAIIYVSTSIPGLTHAVEVGAKELDRGWRMFTALLEYWKHKNSYLIGA